MNIRSFFSLEDFQQIQQKATAHEPFSLFPKHKAKQNKYGIGITGRYIDEDTARDIWHGHNYLVSFTFDYSGKVGIGGKGWAVDTFPMLQSWYSFKDYIDKQMKCYPEYEVEEYGQMSLF